MHLGDTQKLKEYAKTLNQAEAKVEATIARSAEQYEASRRAERVAADLQRAGVAARASAGRIIVDRDGVEALASLLREAGT